MLLTEFNQINYFSVSTRYTNIVLQSTEPAAQCLQKSMYLRCEAMSGKD